MRVVFLGSPPFATPVLQSLLESRHDVVGLVTRPDRPGGRGLAVRASPLAELARARGIPVLQPETTKDPAFVAELRSLTPDVLLVASYGEILRRDVLELAPHGALNVHASLLPRHRGASPIQAAILAGDTETGVSIQRMVLALDEGDVLSRYLTPIGQRENAGDLLNRLSQVGGEAAIDALDRLEKGTAQFRPQDPARATYARRIKKEDGRIDWSKTAVEVDRHVRAMTPWPGARTNAPDGRELVLLEARAVVEAPARIYNWIYDRLGGEVLEGASSEEPGDGSASPGTLVVVDKSPFVVTGHGLLEILALKSAGRSRVDGPAWLRGARVGPGARFGS